MTSLSKIADEADAPGQAIITICIGIFSLVLSDVLAKWLTAHYAPLQIILVRNLLALPMIVAAVYVVGRGQALRTRHLWVHALRGIFWIGAAYTFFSGLKILPLAEATCLVFAAPLFITALSVPLLGEQVGWRRWVAVIAGFVGVLIIVRPGDEAFQPASLFVVATAIFYALFMISARWINRDENMWTMMLYLVLFGILYSAPVIVLQWETVQISHVPSFLGMAVLGTFGITLISHAFRLAPAAIVAPFDYTALVWASLFGWLVWGEIPGAWTYAGAAVIIASGIYIVVRETRQAPAPGVSRSASPPGTSR